MAQEALQIEGTWEQIAALAPSLAGQRFRLTALSEAAPESVFSGPLSEQVATILESPSDSLGSLDMAGAAEANRSMDTVLEKIWATVPDAVWDKFPQDFGDRMDHYLYPQTNN